MPDPSVFSCPTPSIADETIQLAHGSGGRQSQRLLEDVFLPAFGQPAPGRLHDGAVLELGPGRIAFTTDTYVVRPIFFPGGDIGSLAVYGTTNDLAMCGARPCYLSAGFVLEEGLPIAELRQVVRSMAAAAQQAGVRIVTGDTKVVDRGKGDRIFINTAGIGVVPPGIDIAPIHARPGDVLLLSGTLAVHGIAVLSVREGLAFGTTLQSDAAPLYPLVEAALAVAGEGVHVLRDPTRGGLAAALDEIAAAAGVLLRIEETALPMDEDVAGACELLGLDPLHVANEGKCLAIVAPAHAEAVLAAWRAHPLGQAAARIGEVCGRSTGAGTGRGRVVLRTCLGTERMVERPAGEPLPRIC